MKQQQQQEERFVRMAVVYHGAIVRDRTVSPSTLSEVTLGLEPDNTLTVPPVGVEEGFVVLRRAPSGELVLRLRPGMEGELSVRGERMAVAEFLAHSPWVESVGEGLWEVALRESDWVMLRFGGVEVIVQFVLPPSAIRSASRLGGLGGVGAGAFSGLVSPLGLGLVVSLIAQGALLFYAFWSYDPTSAEIEALVDDRWVELVASDVDELAEEEEIEAEEEEVAVLDTLSKRADGEEGRFGQEEAEDVESVLPEVDGPLAETLPKAGLVEAMSGELLEGGAASLFGSGEVFDDSLDGVAIAGDGSAYRPGAGTGMGNMQRGNGGGGTGAGRVGALADKEGGGGRGKPKSLGKPDKVRVKPVLKIEKSMEEGFCEKSNIRDVVSRKAAALRNCYERRLIASPDLEGRVTLQWKVKSDGKVSDVFVHTSTMDDEKAERCLVRTMSRARFDAPMDGGVCVIRYPFTFQPGH